MAVGDVLLRFDGSPLSTVEDVEHHLRQVRPGTVVHLLVERAGRASEMALTVAAAPS
jgi:S1-C subfamily serine protease